MADGKLWREIMIKVFLVEDEAVIRRGIKNKIPWEAEGFEFAGEASDGELAYPLIRNTKPDIVITDINMPGGSGLELIPSYLRLSQAERTRIEKENMGK